MTDFRLLNDFLITKSQFRGNLHLSKELWRTSSKVITTPFQGNEKLSKDDGHEKTDHESMIGIILLYY